MKITGVTPLPSFGTAAVSGTAASGEPFGAAVRGALERLEQTQQSADQEVARAVTGESPDLHRTVVALQTAELSFQLALQVRNKVINAYEEIMRMQV
ncbi:MAG TPA: flagellar hook-basal body complex protein FliE [Blastocatellia bacterium]|nr:flagellar hook-basal body complex protein FliE [Blastocatellia bacterium]